MPLPVLEVPTYETVLPSNKKRIKYRPFLVKEHKVLLMMKDADSAEISRTVSEIIDACTFKKLNIDELAFFDLVYLFIELRKVSIGENLDLIVNCECGNRIDTLANLNNVLVDTNKKHTDKIKITDSVMIQLRYPKLAEGLEAYTSTNIDDTMELLANCVVGITQDDEYFDARDSTKKEILDFLEGLNTAQLSKLIEFFSSMPKVSVDVVTDCPKCNKHHELKLEGLDNFFV